MSELEHLDNSTPEKIDRGKVDQVIGEYRDRERGLRQMINLLVGCISLGIAAAIAYYLDVGPIVAVLDALFAVQLQMLEPVLPLVAVMFAILGVYGMVLGVVDGGTD